MLTGAGRIKGHDVAVVVGEFGFLGGSIGRATARRIVAAITRATQDRLPLLVATPSGGTRMQVGTPAFVEMSTVSKAVVAHKSASLPYLCTCGIPPQEGLASWGSLGHVTVTEPGALIGFLGPPSRRPCDRRRTRLAVAAATGGASAIVYHDNRHHVRLGPSASSPGPASERQAELRGRTAGSAKPLPTTAAPAHDNRDRHRRTVEGG